MEPRSLTTSRRRSAPRQASEARSERFSRPVRASWTPVPMVVFLTLLSLLAWLAPGLLWHGKPAGGTSGTAALLCAGLAVLAAFNLGRRWLTPNRVVLEREQLLAAPLLGPVRRIRYADLISVEERPPSFFGGSGQVEVTVRGRAPLRLDGDIQDHDRLLGALRARVARRPERSA